MKFLQKKAVWVPTVSGAVLILLILGLLFSGLFLGVCPFLAVSRPLPNAELVIIEGWMADEELREVLNEVDSNQTMVVSGGPILFSKKILGSSTYAELGTVRLIDEGVDPARILTVSAPRTDRDRTYIAALAVRQRLEEEGLFGKPAELYTVGAHARRSYLLYQRAFGGEYPLGVSSIAPATYNFDQWYRYSLGVRHVCGELLAWIYAKFFMPS
jgi:hypothetical protein